MVFVFFWFVLPCFALLSRWTFSEWLQRALLQKQNAAEVEPRPGNRLGNSEKVETKGPQMATGRVGDRRSRLATQQTLLSSGHPPALRFRLRHASARRIGAMQQRALPLQLNSGLAESHG